MIKNYFLVTLRNLKRNKVFSFINIFGLAIGLSACFVIWQYVRFESSYDKFHTQADRLYRIPMEVYRNASLIYAGAANAPALGPSMKADFPEVAEFTRLVKTSLFTADLTSYFANSLEFSYQRAGGDLIAFNEEQVYFSDEPLLKMFSFPLLAGGYDALKEPNSVVITESIARKYFGDEPPLGKEMRLNRERVLKVTGVLKDIPENSHLQFDILISFSSMMKNLGNLYESWGWPVFYNYVLLQPSADPSALEAKFPAFAKKYLGEGEYRTRFSMQPIVDIHLRSQLEGEQSANGNQRTVYFLSILAIFILVVAWINYINLSTAKALERSKEVGLRKVVGATKRQLITQFLFDATVLNFLALFLAGSIVLGVWPLFENLVGKHMTGFLSIGLTNDLNETLMVLLIFLAGILFVGFYPALVLASFNPVQVLKGKFYKSSAGSWLRKLMISFQYVLAILLIAGTLTIYFQLGHMREQDPGFVKDQIVALEAPAVYDSTSGDRISFFKNAILQIPGVSNITASSDVPGRKIVENYPISFPNFPGTEAFASFIPSIDTSFLRTYNIHLLEGRLFSEKEKMAFRVLGRPESIRVLVNEEFVRRMGVKDIKEVLNQKLVFWWGPEERHAEIIGVTEDHHQVSFKEPVQPIMYMQPEWTAWKYFSVRIDPRHTRQLLVALEAAYSKTFPENAFTYFFLDEFFDRQYHDDKQFASIFHVFTVLAIIVTCLGLLGLSIFSVTQRTKEIGIRKVVGAPAVAILLLFSKDFLRILMIAYILAVPVIYFAGNKWLENFSFRIPLDWKIYALPPLVLVVITLLTIVVICLKSALANPIKALRHE